jgi:hypothetical protein
LETVAALIDEVRDWPEAVDESPGVLEDLQTLRERLENAERQEIAFALLLRHGNTISGHEVDQRQGRF